MNDFDIYSERAILLAFLSSHYYGHLVPVTDPEPGFEWAVCIHIDDRQHAWHIADKDLGYFSHLNSTDGHYDGHTTLQKYESILRVLNEPR